MSPASRWSITRSQPGTSRIVLKGIATKSSNEKRADNTLWQHFEEIAKDHQNGIFAGTDNTVERLTGKAPMSLPEFLQAHRTELTAG